MILRLLPTAYSQQAQNVFTQLQIPVLRESHKIFIGLTVASIWKMTKNVHFVVNKTPVEFYRI